MIKSMAIGLLFSFFASSAYSQAIIKTGEHADFTRLAINIPVGSNWTVEEKSNGYVVTIENTKFGTLENFFRLIPKTRIKEASVSNDGYSLNLDLECKCRFLAELWRPNWLLVDIYDETLPSIQSVESAPLIEPVPSIQGRLDNINPSYAAMLPIVTKKFDTSGLPKATVDFEMHTNANTADAQSTAFETAIRSSLDSAATQGFVNFQSPHTETDPNRTSGQIVKAINSDLLPGLSTGTPFQNVPPLELVLPIETNLEHCITSAQLELSDWGDDSSFSEQIAKARALIVGEFDRPNIDAVLDLARLYIYFGFGQEAVAVLSVDDRNSEEHRLIMALANIIDDIDENTKWLMDQIECNADIAFWSFVQGGSIELLKSDSIEGVILAFKALPKELRKLLGPRFASALRDIDATEAAVSVLLPAIDSPEESIELRIETINQEIDRGNLKEATIKLTDLANFDQRMTPQGLIQLIELNLKNIEPIDDSLISLLRTMEFEFRGTEWVEELNDLHIKILIHNGEYLAAIAMYEEIVSDGNVNQSSQNMEDIWTGVVENGSLDLFLSIAFSDKIISSGPEILKKYSQKLMDIGFVERATELIELHIESIDDVNVDYSVDQLKVGSNSAIDDSITATIGSEMADFRDQNWENLLDSPDEMFQQIARRQEGWTPFEAGAGPMSLANELITDSNDLRITVNQLLGRFGDVAR